METVEMILMFSGGAIALVFVYAIYTFLLKPRTQKPGVYINPKIGRRKVGMIMSPDCTGTIKEFIVEEGETEAFTEYVSIVVDSYGEEVIIPHVNEMRDLRPYNIKQTFAGSDHPILLCCVDRDGRRHPEMFNAMLYPKDAVRDIGVTDLMTENKRLRTSYAKLKQDMNAVQTDDNLYDKIENVTDRISRLRNSLLKYSINEQEGDDDNNNSGDRR